MMKDVKGYENIYAVTEEGQVWSYRSKKFLKPYTDGHGYLKVKFCTGGGNVQRRVHRIVLETFNPVEGMEELEVNHLDENKLNNNLSNLSWTTRLENIRYGTGIQRSAEKRGKAVEQYTMDGELIAEYPSMSEAERQVGISNSNISRVCNGHGVSAGGYIWRFADNGN